MFSACEFYPFSSWVFPFLPSLTAAQPPPRFCVKKRARHGHPESHPLRPERPPFGRLRPPRVVCTAKPRSPSLFSACEFYPFSSWVFPFLPSLTAAQPPPRFCVKKRARHGHPESHPLRPERPPFGRLRPPRMMGTAKPRSPSLFSACAFLPFFKLGVPIFTKPDSGAIPTRGFVLKNAPAMATPSRTR